MNRYVARHASWFGWSARAYDADKSRTQIPGRHRTP